MKRLAIAAALVFAVFAALAAFGASLSPVQRLEASAVSTLDIDTVFDRIDDLGAHASWSPHLPDGADVSFGTREGEGATLAWSRAGEVGSVEIVQSVAPELARVAVVDAEGARMLTYALAGEGEGTVIVATQERELGGPLERAGAFLRKGGAQAALEASVERLAAATPPAAG